MRGKVAFVVLFALVAAVAANETIKGSKAVARELPKNTSPNPLTSFQSGCPTCMAPYTSCMWCANNGYGCFLPQPFGASCCGCANGVCYVCPASSSCATWSVYNPGFCPPPNNNNNATVYGTCTWQSRVTLQYQEKSVLRCHSIPTNINAVVNWNIRPNSDGQFSVWILDQRNFDLYISNQAFACLNQNCQAADSSPKYGQFVNFGSPGYYIVITKTNQNWSGTSSYLIDAFVR